MKKLPLFLLAAVAATSLAGCSRVVPGAWVKANIEGGFAWYSQYMYGENGGHILIFDDESKMFDSEGVIQRDNRVGEILFDTRILGAEDIEYEGETIRGTWVDISRKVGMSASIDTSSPLYSPDKNFYLNGVELTNVNTFESTVLAFYTYENLPLIRRNPGGHLQEDAVNFIEYK